MSSLVRPDIFEIIRDTMPMGVHQYKFKNGAFTDKIFKETPAVDALNILISSGETNAEEKAIFKAIRKIYINFRNHSVSYPMAEDILGVAKVWQAFGKLFTNYAKARGMYVPPTTYQVMNDDSTVEKTIVLNDDGTETVYRGGVAGMPPGAPEEFVKEQTENAKMLNSAAKHDPAQVIIGNRFNPKMIPSDPKLTGTTNNTSPFPRSDDYKESMEEDKLNKEVGDNIKSPNKGEVKEKLAGTDTAFGKAFSKKLRGAFCKVISRL
ncbi:hypothetical protein N431DRAFT_481332 [Stipitochalara longipes BDJ]|nr:hypothetical protein N431DRAFT_481332 [Stipitochalara longipes BDJ]